jgi:hypothetical protein
MRVIRAFNWQGVEKTKITFTTKQLEDLLSNRISLMKPIIEYIEEILVNDGVVHYNKENNE